MTRAVESPLSYVTSRAWRRVSRFAPPITMVNRLVAGLRFRRNFGRWPLPPNHPEALVNDFILDRMTSDCWSALHLRCVDKEFAKTEALRLDPTLKFATTRAVVAMRGVRSARALTSRLRSFIGADVFAKPTHGCGGVTRLLAPKPGDIARLYRAAKRDFFYDTRETQYRALPRKIIVEDHIPTATGVVPDDFKFHCVAGEPLLCQIDHGRAGVIHRKLFTTPDFSATCVKDGVDLPDGLRMPSSERLAAMEAVARALSAPFDYVRIDLYDGVDGVYFGEFTFTPGGAIGIAPSAPKLDPAGPTHSTYSRIMMGALQRGSKLLRK